MLLIWQWVQILFFHKYYLSNFHWFQKTILFILGNSVVVSFLLFLGRDIINVLLYVFQSNIKNNSPFLKQGPRAPSCILGHLVEIW